MVKINETQSLGFFAREKPLPIDDELLQRAMKKSIEKENDTHVTIIRGLLFFHAEQKDITLGKLREFFTERSIKLFEIDGYIKINR
jgi:hypothetical protein